jgi:hypothetical protein
MQFIPANITRNRYHQREDWFEQRRDFFVRRVYDDFFAIIRAFQEVYQLYLSCRKPGLGACADLLDRRNNELRTTIWDRLTAMVGTEADKGPLWCLKDLCHRIWPQEEYGHFPEGGLVDWLIGSIFHEAMKLKENIYLLNSYGPAAFRLSDRDGDDGPGLRPPAVPSPGLARMMDIKGVITRIVGDVAGQVEHLGFLFGQANCLLRTMLPELGRNMLLIRLLAEQEDVVRELWGENMEEIFTDMFFGAPEQGFCAAGRSYLSGQWYAQALEMYRRAMHVAPDCDEALAKVHQLRAVVETGCIES